MELLPSLLSGLKAVCATFPDPRQGRGGNIGRADFGLSAFAMFFLQSASFLAFQRRLEKGQGRSNCQTLFGIEKIPSDNYIRKMLDMADPARLQSSFERVEQLLAHPALRQSFGRLGGRILLAWDGTEYFRSEKLRCSNCLTGTHSQGRSLSHPAGGIGRGAGPFQGDPAVSRIYRATRWCREAGLRTQRCEAVVP